ncbi:MAG: 16S rRNA (guanine(527)-N(7))-methyltransferase RsmG [Clostridium sp.]|nr:16S rRNA (guanine(527)-N(7))-methyltransferase RsmG [Clostridium sp.]MCM1443761.1 16S rRNA (guanine(527)-N(7))-methyltransferase RsmG [Candidatus Amulumruptor caecigallinarius]
MNIDEFVEEIKKIGISLTNNQLNQLNEYYNLLIEYNKVMNLTGITEKKQVYLKHFYDSLCIVKVIDLKNEKTLCDVGTGAGMPGIILKIVYPNLKVTLIEAINKRVKFLNIVINKLNLKDIEVICIRAEEYAINTREKYDIVTCRAVSNLRVLLELCIPMVKVNKYFIPLKGIIETELEESNNALFKLNCKILKIEKFKLPIEQSYRSILKIQKTEKTNKLFPRKYSDIKKKLL